jgi:glycine/D-amino acid oxidase-like deaminating enzyme
MGASTALHLARRGRHVTLFDRAAEPFSGASRWNEGKIHLGFLYAADPSLRTARALLPGGLDFRPQVERLTGISLRAVTTHQGDHYLAHRDSVVGADAIGAYLRDVAQLVEASPRAPDYLVDVSTCRVDRLTSSELSDLADRDAVVAGYRVPEHSVDTQFVADAFVHAVREEPSIELALGQRVTGVERAGADDDEWCIVTGNERHGPYRGVVNASWEGRPAIDLSIGHRPDVDQQFRYRVSVFAHADHELDVPCAVLGVGPFGDVKNYDGRNFYLSWYPAGLVARAEGDTAPSEPELSADDRAELRRVVFDALAARLPYVERIDAAVTDARVEGGWVYSQGRGRLDDPRASVHRRNRLGISNIGTYYSVDTGKYSVAPTLADHLARRILAATT